MSIIIIALPEIDIVFRRANFNQSERVLLRYRESTGTGREIVHCTQLIVWIDTLDSLSNDVINNLRHNYFLQMSALVF